MKTGTTWMKRVIVAGMAMQMVVAGRAVAADAGLEFGVQDDLSVYGTEGTLQDADLEVRGYSLFGSTNGLTVPAAFSSGAGSVVIASNLFVNGQLKAGAIDMNGAFGVSGATTLGSTLNVSGATVLGSTLNVTGATVLGSSLDVTGNGTVGGTLGVTGAAILSSTLNVTGGVTLGNGLSVTGVTALSSNLVVNSTLDSADKSTGALVVVGGAGVGKNLNVGGTVGIGNTVPDANTTLQVKGGEASGDYVAKFYSGTTMAAWIKKK